MNAGKKMALVPVEMVENIMWNSALSALQNPNKDQLLKSTESVNKLNDNTDLPENIKVDRQAKNKKDASFMSSKLIPTLTRQDKKIDDDYQKHFENVSRTYQQSTKAILRELKHHSNCLQIDQQTNEVTIDGEKLVKSDLFYLILDVVRPSNALLPLHGECFLKFLRLQSYASFISLSYVYVRMYMYVCIYIYIIYYILYIICYILYIICFTLKQ